MNGVTLERAQAAKAILVAALAGRSELRGIGITRLECGFGVKVNLSRQPEEWTVPDEVDGVPVIVDVVGTIHSL